MKVLLAGYVLGQGGIQNHLRWLAKALGEAGVEVLVLSVSSQTPESTDWQWIQEFKSDRVHFNFYSTARENQASSSFAQLKNLREIAAIIKAFSPDVYLAVGTGWNLFLPPLLAATRSRKVFHEVMSGLAGNWRNSRWAVRWGFDEVVGQSQIVAETFAESFGWKQPIAAIPALPEPLEITARLPQVTSRSVALGQAKVALFSRLVPHKQAFWLVQQWDLLKDIVGELHIHGSGPEEPLIREYIAAKGWGDRVQCFGRYPQGQSYVDLLSSYDLTVLPTVGAEGAPLVLLESIACGVPFVAYGVGGIPDYGTDNPDVLIVAPEPWVTDQAKTYADVSHLKDAAEQKPFAFVAAVRQMTLKLAAGQIQQARLQQFYLEHYSYSVLKKSWLSYLEHHDTPSISRSVAPRLH